MRNFTGWFKAPRNIFSRETSNIFHDDKMLCFMFLELMSWASYEESSKTKVGQILTSYSEIAKGYNESRWSIRRKIKKLESFNLIKIVENTKNIIIEIQMDFGEIEENTRTKTAQKPHETRTKSARKPHENRTNFINDIVDLDTIPAQTPHELRTNSATIRRIKNKEERIIYKETTLNKSSGVYDPKISDVDENFVDQNLNICVDKLIFSKETTDILKKHIEITELSQMMISRAAFDRDLKPQELHQIVVNFDKRATFKKLAAPLPYLVKMINNFSFDTTKKISKKSNEDQEKRENDSIIPDAYFKEFEKEFIENGMKKRIWKEKTYTYIDFSFMENDIVGWFHPLKLGEFFDYVREIYGEEVLKKCTQI